MKTDELISMLATDVTPVDRHVPTKRLGTALALGGIGAVLLMYALFGIRPDLGRVIDVPLFWAKLALPFSLGAAALWATARLSRPGVAAGGAWAAVALPVMMVWAAAIVVLASAAPADRPELVLGSTWRVCPFNIALLSVPAFAAIMLALRGLAPTRLRLAGAAGGLLAGATATIAYSLHCPEMGVAFWAVWYVLGMLIPTALGAAFGPAMLRW
ncbi:MAG: DUF1109 domain-containing protein [Pararobbsia sp.]